MHFPGFLVLPGFSLLYIYPSNVWQRVKGVQNRAKPETGEKLTVEQVIKTGKTGQHPINTLVLDVG
jgi:hypothetical protein